MKSRFHHRYAISFLLMSLFLPILVNAELMPSLDYPLLEAVKKNDVQTVRMILNKTPSAFIGNEVNRKDITGDVALSVAASNGNLDLVRLLVQHGAIVDAGKEADRRTPLINASARGHSEVVRYLISRGADVNAKGGVITPLLAAFSGRYSSFNNPRDIEETIYVLLENGADINVQDESWMKTRQTPLMYAVMQGDAALVKVLLSKGARLDLQNKENETALSLAKKNGLEYIAQLLEKPDRVSKEALKQVVSTGNHLFVAVKQGHINQVKTLINGGADVDLRAPGGDTPLIVAADENKLEIVRLLLHLGADVNAINGANDTALIRASIKGHTSVVKELLKARADVNVKNAAKGDALIYGVMSKKTQVIGSLLKAGARTNDRYDDEKTALIIVAEHGHADIAGLLLAHKADANAVDKDERTALMIASKKGNIELVRMLLKSGADANKQSKYGDTALDEAISANNIRIVSMLIKNNRNLDRRKAISSAVIAGNLEIAKLLYTTDTDVNMRGFAGGTLLMLAADEDLALVKFLVDRGAGINLHDDEGNTALMKAVTSLKKANISTIKFLINRGADINAANKKGETALIVAVKGRNPDMVKVLVEKGSTLSLKDKEGKSAWTYAFESDQKSITDLLEKAGAGRDYFGMKWDGYVSKQKEEFTKVVDTPKEWSELWQRAFAKPAPVMDFEKYVVACVFLGYNAQWLYSIGFNGAEPVDGKLVISYALHDVMLRLSGPFRAGGQYAMKAYEKKNGIEIVLQERGSTTQIRR
jgi:ankyrin repeat protein